MAACSLRHSRFVSPSRIICPKESLMKQSAPSCNSNRNTSSNIFLSKPNTRPFLTNNGKSHNNCTNNVMPRNHKCIPLSSSEIDTRQNNKIQICQFSENAKGRSSYLDFNSVLRTVGSLNLEVPKYFGWPRNPFKKNNPADNSKATDASVSPEHGVQQNGNQDPNTTINEKLEHINQSRQSDIATDSLSSSAGANNQKERPIAQKEKIKSKRVEREQYDFVSAMVEQEESIKKFFLNSAKKPNVKSNQHIVPASADLKPQDVNNQQTEPNSQAGKLTNMTRLSNSSKAGANNTYVTTTAENAMNLVKNITSFIPGLARARPSNLPGKDNVKNTPKKIGRKSVVARGVVDRKTRGLVKALKIASSSASKLVRLEEVCHHLTAHPEAKSLAVKEKLIPCLLRLRACKDVVLREQSMEALALVGHIDHVSGRGIRILTIDGGGTRGLVAIEILRRLEETCQMDIHKMFDYICGVSTGSLIGIMLGAHKVSLDEAEDLYKRFSREIFNRYKLMGMGKLMMSHAYYDAQLWEKILRENIGLQTFIESTRDPNTPKVAAVSTLMNMVKLSNFLFRNYNYPSGVQSQIPGSCKYKFWEAIRASSAAPGYYEEFELDQWIHQDGGIITNNPTSIAIHEAKLLWPNDSLQCVVSIGTGRYQPTIEPESINTGLRNQLTKIIQSATDTEAVHTTLHDLLPPSTYFRFNPYMSEDYFLDEIRLDRWDQMRLDTQLYCRKNHFKIQKASNQLLLAKLPHQKVNDWARGKWNEFV